jgi:hypothetical protein
MPEPRVAQLVQQVITIALRVVGGVLFAVGLLNLGALLYLADSEALRSPVMVGIRHTLMCAAGVGFLMLRKWGAVVFAVSVLINWIAYFTIYDGRGTLESLWLAILLPLTIGLLLYATWNKLKWK